MNRRLIPLLLVALAFAALLPLTACGRLAGPAPKVPNDYNLILVSLNNMAAEHMSLYGYPRKTTPHLDRLAQEALVFEDVYAPNSWTLPGATSVFTSLQPYTHGVMDRWTNNMLNAGIPTLGEILKSKGYATATFTGGLDYRPTFGHLRGIQDASFNLDFTKFPTVFNQAERWLTYNGQKKFLLVLQGYDAHPPFQPPSPFKGVFSGGKRNVRVSTQFALRGYKQGDKYVASYIWQESDPKLRSLFEIAYPPEKRTVELTQDDMDYLRDLYDECLLSLDDQVNRFLSRMDPKVREKTILVFFSEHGEMFGKHGRFGRAGTVRGTLFDEVVHVPLIVFTPQKLKGRIQGLAQLVDFAPTFLDLMGLEPLPHFQGKSLLPLLEGKTVNEYVYAGSGYNVGDRGAQHPFMSEASLCESIRSHKWKLVHEVFFPKGMNRMPAPDTLPEGSTETWELYDLKSNPDESADLMKSYPEIARSLQEQLGTWSRQTREAFADKRPTTVEVPPDFEEKARFHGYW